MMSGVAERFYRGVDVNGPLPELRPDLGPCWLWTLSVCERRGGYGQFSLGGRMRKAHQVSYELAVGPVPDGLELDHLCRRPACVRPTHLEPVTRLENFLRGDHPSAVAYRAGTCRKGHSRQPETTRYKPNGDRVCRSSPDGGVRMRACEHYVEAEEQIRYADEAQTESLETRHLLCANVHATLALAGATAMQAYVRGDSDELADWEAAAGGDG